jgi:hypothetical protein
VQKANEIAKLLNKDVKFTDELKSRFDDGEVLGGGAKTNIDNM